MRFSLLVASILATLATATTVRAEPTRDIDLGATVGVDGIMRRLLDLLGSTEIGVTLREIHGAMHGGKPRHLTNDRLGEVCGASAAKLRAPVSYLCRLHLGLLCQ